MTKRRRVSFDLYDTLVYRSCSDPKQIFALIESESPELANFKRKRIQAERLARRRHPSGECTLSEIYEQLAISLRLPTRRLREIEQRELELEFDCMRMAAGSIALLEEAHNAFDEVWLITDMYLPFEYIERLLKRFALFDYFHKILLSSTEHASKHRGSIYEKYSEPDVEWIHYGDNRFADVKQAKKKGVDGRHVATLISNRFESRMSMSGEMARALADLSRHTRAGISPASVSHATTIGASVSGPLVFEYIAWIQKQAIELRIDRLVFLARDGQLPYKAYQLFRAANPGLPPAIYLPASRAAWILPILRAKPDLLGKIASKHLPPSPREALISLGLSEEMDPVCPGGTNVIEMLRSKLSSPRGQTLLNERWSDCIAVFREAGIFTASRVGLVDIGWKGTMQEWFETLVASTSTDAAGPQVVGLNYALEVKQLPSKRLACIRGGRFYPTLETLYPSLLEMLLPADHGQTLRYERSGGMENPVAVMASQPVAPKDQIIALHEAALAFVRNCIASRQAAVSVRPALEELALYPNREDLAFFDEFRFNTHATEEKSGDQLIAKHTLGSLLRLLFSPRRNTPKWPWPAATVRTRFPNTPRIALRLLHAKLLACKALEKLFFAFQGFCKKGRKFSKR